MNGGSRHCIFFFNAPLSLLLLTMLEKTRLYSKTVCSDNPPGTLFPKSFAGEFSFPICGNLKLGIFQHPLVDFGSFLETGGGGKEGVEILHARAFPQVPRWTPLPGKRRQSCLTVSRMLGAHGIFPSPQSMGKLP